MRITILTFLVLAGSGLMADPVADLRTTLDRFLGQDSVRAKVEVQTWSRSGEGKKAKERQSTGQVQVEDGPQGLRMAWTAQQVQAARKDALTRAGNPDAATPNLDSLTALGVSDATRILSYADYLRLKLQGAQLLEDKAELWQGKPARLLVLKPEVKFSSEDKDMIKSFESTLKIWLGGDGVPVAMEETTAYKGSKFLITFKGSHSEATTLGRAGNRLVALRSTRESGGSGLGMSVMSKVVTSLSVF